MRDKDDRIEWHNTSFRINLENTSIAPVYVPGGEHCILVLIVSKLRKDRQV